VSVLAQVALRHATYPNKANLHEMRIEKMDGASNFVTYAVLDKECSSCHIVIIENLARNVKP